MKAYKRILALSTLVVSVCLMLAGCGQGKGEDIMLGENYCMCIFNFEYALDQSKELTEKEMAKHQEYLTEEKVFEIGEYSFTLKKADGQRFDRKNMRYITLYLLNATYDYGPLHNNYPIYVLNEYDGNISAGAKYHGSDLVSLSFTVAMPTNANIEQMGEQVIQQLCEVDGFEKTVEKNDESKYVAEYTSKNVVPQVKYTVSVSNNGDHIKIGWYKNVDWSDGITDELKQSIDIDECYSRIEKLLFESVKAGGEDPANITVEGEPQFYVTDAGELSVYYPKVVINMQDGGSCHTDVCVHTGKHVQG